MLPLGAAHPARVIANHFGAAILATALWVGLARMLMQSLEFDQRASAGIPYLVTLGLLFYSLSVAVHYVALATQASKAAAIEARDAELRALKAQINPHFLFNSLNSITALIASDPPRAREMCIRLADFLRSTLGLGEKESVLWRDEIQLAQTYLEVEQIRFGSRLRVEFQTAGACGECRVPPLVLQPLIENAVKHGIATLSEGGTIKVKSWLDDGQLQVRIENGYDPEHPAPRRNGLGLRNVRERLETRFGNAAQLTSRADANLFRTEMSLPCQKMD
jgi:two-component system sensor histidine kinase AlgZ